MDTDTGQVGPEVAELLRLPFVSGVRELAIAPDGKELTATCRTRRRSRRGGCAAACRAERRRAALFAGEVRPGGTRHGGGFAGPPRRRSGSRRRTLGRGGEPDPGWRGARPSSPAGHGAGCPARSRSRLAKRSASSRSAGPFPSPGSRPTPMTVWRAWRSYPARPPRLLGLSGRRWSWCSSSRGGARSARAPRRRRGSRRGDRREHAGALQRARRCGEIRRLGCRSSGRARLEQLGTDR